jgi:hypothetical protein
MAGPHPSHPWIKLDDAPIYVLEYPTGNEKNYFHDLAAMYAAYLAWLKDQPRRHVTISDLRRLVSSARGRQMATDFYQATLAFERTYLLARGYLTLDERNRHVITAVTWGTNTDIPKGFFDNKPDALAWARKILDAE